MTDILDYLDEFIERERIRTGDYPKFIELNKVSIDKMKEAIKNHKPELDMCWTDLPKNYRGIKIREKK